MRQEFERVEEIGFARAVATNQHVYSAGFEGNVTETAVVLDSDARDHQITSNYPTFFVRFGAGLDQAHVIGAREAVRVAHASRCAACERGLGL